MTRTAAKLALAVTIVAGILTPTAASAAPVKEQPSPCSVGYHLNHYGLCVNNTRAFSGQGRF